MVEEQVCELKGLYWLQDLLNITQDRSGWQALSNAASIHVHQTSNIEGTNE